MVTQVNLGCMMKLTKFRVALITKCGLYVHGSLFTLLYFSININRCIQKLEWCTRKPRMYDETHKIRIALTTNVISKFTVPCSL